MACLLSSCPQACPKDWKVFVYLAAVVPHNASEAAAKRSPVDDALRTRGRLGLESLIALLLALEAKYYVLARRSEWSWLVDDLRKSLVHAHCGGCTNMADLRER